MYSPQLLCEGCVTNQADQRFSLWQGLSEPHQTQLLDFSQHDPLVTRHTSDQERFASAEKLQQWLAGDRLVFALTPQENPDELAGLFWFSHEALPLKVEDERVKNTEWTMAIRLYEAARGKRLSSSFMKASFEFFWRQHPKKSVWLSTNEDNEVSQKIYTQFGFTPLARQAGKVFYLLSV